MNSRLLALVHNGSIIEEESLSLAELCRACGTHAEWIICLVDESIIEPEGEEMRSWRFSGDCLLRARSALRLQRDLGLNLAGIALVLNLLEELDELRTHLKLHMRYDPEQHTLN